MCSVPASSSSVAGPSASSSAAIGAARSGAEAAAPPVLVSAETKLAKEAEAEAEATTKPKGATYSYKTYKPTPKLVYARYEGEADRIAETLRG